jgi:hypothetical protein
VCTDGVLVNITKAIVAGLFKKLAKYCGAEGSLPHSQNPAIGPYPETDEYS